MNLGKMFLFNALMGMLLALCLPFLASMAPDEPTERHFFEIVLVVLGLGWISVLLLGTLRLARTGKLF